MIQLDSVPVGWPLNFIVLSRCCRSVAAMVPPMVAGRRYAPVLSLGNGGQKRRFELVAHDFLNY